MAAAGEHVSAADLERTYRDRSVLVTGHTGFTGGWLCSWLHALGARVHGLSLPPETTPNLFELININERLASSRMGDISDRESVTDAFAEARPEIVLHLAAQPIVSLGYDDPHGTFMTNVMGTLNVLEAARRAPETRAVVCVTTDKVYENREWHYGYRETDRLGGKDPYSASKVGTETVVSTYQRTLAARGNGVRIAAARGGNIIGGGDWARDRIVPDFVRAATGGHALSLRNPTATRPWQHVLALAHGYLALGQRLLEDEAAVGAWNFGPDDGSNRSVGALVETLASHWPGVELRYNEGAFPEAHFLHLTSEKARAELDWCPPLNFERTVAMTADWYRAVSERSATARETTDRQIAQYRALIA